VTCKTCQLSTEVLSEQEEDEIKHQPVDPASFKCSIKHRNSDHQSMATNDTHNEMRLKQNAAKLGTA